MKLRLLQLLFLSLFNILMAQDELRYNIHWKKNPELHVLDSSQNEIPAVYIQDFRYVDFVTGYEVFTYKTAHQIIKINNEVGLDRFNEMSTPYSGQLTRLKVRIISPKGNVKEYYYDDLKITYDPKIGTDKFAIEGLEIGCEIELLCTYRNGIVATAREYFQHRFPINKMRFELTPHNYLSYLVKTYNGLGEAELFRGKIVIADSNIVGLSAENISSVRAMVKRLDYKLKKYPDGTDYLTWESIANRKLTDYQQNNGGKKVAKFLESLHLDSLSLDDKLYRIESEIKETIAYKLQGRNENRNLGTILKEKLADNIGMLALYMKCFKQLDVDVHLMFASSRKLGEIDMYFPHEMDLSVPLFYFPEIDKYICPFQKYMRLGYPHSEVAGSMAFSIKTTSAPLSLGYYYDSYEFKKLPLYSSNISKIKTTNYIAINEALDGLKIKHRNSKSGYDAFFVRYLSHIEEVDSILNTITGIDDLEVKTFSMSKEDIELSRNPRIPVKVQASLSSKELVSKIDDNIFVKVGKLIGKQSSIFESKERVKDVMLAYPKKYEHTIVLYIPEGYKCSNLEDLKGNLSLTVEGEELMYFKSDYEIKGQQLTITLNEGYNVYKLTKTYYIDYKNIINAAFNFNQVELILEKED